MFDVMLNLYLVKTTKCKDELQIVEIWNRTARLVSSYAVIELVF